MKYFYNKSLLLLSFSLYTLISLNAQSGTLNVTSPSGVAGDYNVELAGFIDCEFESISGTLALAVDDFGTATACNMEQLSGVGTNVSGKIAIMDRGDCPFTHKIFEAQEAGAIAVIVCNNVSDGVLSMGGEDEDIAKITIPSMMLSLADCNTLKAEIGNDISVTAERVLFVDMNANDRVVWGANGEGSFEDGLGDWTVVGLSDDSHVWTWNGQSNITSKTSCGSALFNLQEYQVADGFDLDNPGPAPYNQYSGELISPSMDLSSSQAVALKFYQYNLALNTTTTFATSIDGGTTWSDPINIESVNTQDSDDIITELLRIPLTDVAGESDVKVKFIVDGDFFFWSVDDVEIVELEGINVSVSSIFYTPLAFGLPKSHADADTFFFSTMVTNNGGESVPLAQLDVEIINEDTGASVFSTSGTTTDIPVATTIEISADDVFSPADLDIGTYSINYSVQVIDASEEVINDNSGEKFFQITDNIFSKEYGVTTFLGGLGGNWGAAAVYPISKNVTDFVATTTTIAVATNADTLTDNYIDIFLLKLEDGLDFSNFDLQETDLFGHPSFEVVSQNTHVFTTEGNGALIDVPFSSSDQGVPLDPGAAYMVMVKLDDNQVGNAQAVNSDLFIGYNDDPRIAQDEGFFFITQLLVVEEDEQWYTGAFGTGVPVLRMSVDMISDTDDTPLPVGSFEVFPNPASDMINVNLNLEEPSNATIVMSSLEGKILEVKELTNVSTRKMEMNISHLPSGTYILKAYTERGSTTHKVIVAK